MPPKGIRTGQFDGASPSAEVLSPQVTLICNELTKTNQNTEQINE